MSGKSTVDEIRRRFDADVERFSNLETGQSATVDAPLAMALVAQAAAVTTPHARHVLDVGCGAGNYTLKLLESLPNLDATLIDLSQPMLDRARERVSRATAGRITTVQADIREARLPDGGSTSCWRLRSCTTCAPTRSGGTCSRRCTGRCGPAARCGCSIWWRVRSRRSGG
jgi:SAM-dependent methyltransferase